jgi:6-phosphogluconolactonase (cycloisomerase 2 family)
MKIFTKSISLAPISVGKNICQPAGPKFSTLLAAWAMLFSLMFMGLTEAKDDPHPRHVPFIEDGEGGAKLDHPASVVLSSDNQYAYVASWSSDALEIIDISNPAAPFHVGSISDGEGGAKLYCPNSVTLSSDEQYAYVASFCSDALEIIDISDPAVPFHVSSISNGKDGAKLDGPQSVTLSSDNQYAYVVSNNSHALEIIDISDLAFPFHVSSITDGEGGAKLDSPRSVTLSSDDQYAYVASRFSNALSIINISDPTSPFHVSSVSNKESGAKLYAPNSVTLSSDDQYAYVASTGSNALEIIDISDPAVPFHVSSVSHGEGGAKLGNPVFVTLSSDNKYAYLVSFISNALEIIDISDPAVPFHVSSISDREGGAKLDYPRAVAVSSDNKYAYVTSFYSDALEIIDISDFSYPTETLKMISTPVTAVIFNHEYQYLVEAVNPDENALTFSLTTAPKGMTIEPTHGLIRWTPTRDNLGEHQITVGVTDGNFNDSQTYTLTVSTNAPRVTRQSPEGDSETAIENLYIWFSRSITPATVTPDVISFTGPNGNIPISGVTKIHESLFNITFPVQSTVGEYHLIIPATVADRLGNPMDQDQDGNLGEQGEDSYDASFNLIDVDLILSNVTAPNEFWSGGTATISWEGSNQNSTALVGSWTDGVYFSEDDKWDIDDQLLATVLHTGGLEENEVYKASAEVVVPGNLHNYYVLVRTDIYNQELEGEDEGNNTQAKGPVALKIQTLKLNESKTGTFVSSDRFNYYAIEMTTLDIATAEYFFIALDDANDDGANEIYVSYNEVPTRSKHDYKYQRLAADQTLKIPATRAGTYYVLGYGLYLPDSPAAFTIRASLPTKFEVESVTPTSASNTGHITLQVNGTSFQPAANVKLKQADTVLEAIKQEFTDSTRLYATFDLAGQATGSYEVIVENSPANPVSSPIPFEVKAGDSQTNQAKVNLIAPNRVRRDGNDFIFIVEVYNDGLNDVPVPLLWVGNTVSFGLSRGNYVGNRHRFLATNTSGGPAGILRPGQKEVITFYSKNTGRSKYTMFVDRIFKKTQGQPFDWEGVRRELLPHDMTEAEFAPIFAQLKAQVGPTNRDYLNMLAQNATLMQAEYGDNRNEDELLRLSLTKVRATMGTSISGQVLSPVQADVTGIQVRAANLDTSENFTAITLNDGSFIFEALTAGTYAFTVTSALIKTVSPDPVVLEAGQALSNVTIVLEKPMKLFGNAILASTGKPVTKAAVMMFEEAEEAGKMVNAAVTDQYGYFSFSALPPGAYAIMIQTEEDKLARTWLRNIAVNKGDTLIDLGRVEMAQESKVTANVSLADGKEIENISVILLPKDDTPFPLFIKNFTKSSVAFGSLPAGTYDISILSPGYIPALFEDVNIAETTVYDLGSIELEVDNGEQASLIEANDLSLVRSSNRVDLGLYELEKFLRTSLLSFPSVMASSDAKNIVLRYFDSTSYDPTRYVTSFADFQDYILGVRSFFFPLKEIAFHKLCVNCLWETEQFQKTLL